jgi:hypothetical protein
MRCAFVTVFFCLSLGFASGQVELSPSSSTPPEVHGLDWSELDSLLLNLSSEVTLLEETSRNLSNSLLEAQSSLETLSSKLQKSQAEASALRSSLRQSLDSLETLKRSMGIELWIWRGAAAAGVGLALFALLR